MSPNIKNLISCCIPRCIRIHPCARAAIHRPHELVARYWRDFDKGIRRNSVCGL